MKKLQLLAVILVFASFLNACSGSDSDNSSSYGVVKFKVNGVQKVFKQVVVSIDAISGPHVDHVFAVHEFDGSDAIYFYLLKNDNEDGTVGDFKFGSGGVYYDDLTPLNKKVTQSDNGHWKGTFSGTLHGAPEGGEPIELSITDGSFDVHEEQ